MRNLKSVPEIVADAGIAGDARCALLEMNQRMTWREISDFLKVSPKKIWEFVTQNKEKKQMKKAEYVKMYRCDSCGIDKAAVLMRTHNDCQRCAKLRRMSRV